MSSTVDDRSTRTTIPKQATRIIAVAACTLVVLTTGSCSASSDEERAPQEDVVAPSNDPSDAPQVPESAKYQRERQDLVDELWSEGKTTIAREIADGATTYAKEEANSFVPDGWTLLNIRYREHHPAFHYVATDSDETTISLTGNPDAYDIFVESAGIEVDSEESAIAAVTFYVLTTRDAGTFRAVVKDSDDLTLDHAPLPDVKEEVRKAREGARDVIAEPAAEQDDDGGYRVTVYYQESDTLRSWTGTVSANGALDGDSETHTTGLPVMFVE
ncbi:hypothetical protein F4561_005619 [Lipingzhangella halophila]|uniref:Uncharacterized protein n=1 Tax=Lipingzhangella halophila TaxID=1783352 RepID=A0A7W7W6C6_9ACTN|nr:hypothetical protein [Lipingzhangella halophila]MBB4934725.1 hypothetical protein [Lipingzhangella halophila]